jgi:hypothetical protein
MREFSVPLDMGQWVRSCARHLALLGCGEGVARSGTACPRVCRQPVRTGRRGRPPVGAEPGLLLGPGVKRDGTRRVASVDPRGVRRPDAAIAAVLAATRRGTRRHTASSARRNATWRASLASLVRRGRALAHTAAGLSAGRWLVGWASNCCWRPQRRRWTAPAGAPWQWPERTPALAAGLTHPRWTRRARRHDQGPLPAWVAPTRRGRPPQRACQPVTAVAA